MRLKRYRTEIAGARAEEIEREHLHRPFNNVLFYQIRVVVWDFLIGFVTKVTACPFLAPYLITENDFTVL